MKGGSFPQPGRRPRGPPWPHPGTTLAAFRITMGLSGATPVRFCQDQIIPLVIERCGPATPSAAVRARTGR